MFVPMTIHKAKVEGGHGTLKHGSQDGDGTQVVEAKIETDALRGAISSDDLTVDQAIHALHTRQAPLASLRDYEQISQKHKEKMRMTC